jgi:uncharacterized membrane protein YdbT with pleckstrin-like domain
MPPTLDASLLDGERVVFSVRLSKWVVAPQFALGCILVALAVSGALQRPSDWWSVLPGLAVVAWLHAWIKHRATELTISNKRVVVKLGFIARKITELPLTKVESIQVEQGILGRVLGYGTVVVGGTGGALAPLQHVAAAVEFRRQFMAAAEAARSRETK